MSRAFVKEDVNGPPELPDLPLSPHPNYVTPRGLAHLQARLRDTQATLAQLRARAERLDKLPEAAAERPRGSARRGFLGFELLSLLGQFGRLFGQFLGRFELSAAEDGFDRHE